MSSLESGGVPDKGFLFTPTDANPIKNPAGQVVRAVTLTTKADGNVSVTYAGNKQTVVIPMLSGQRRSMVISHVNATGTDSGIVSGGVILETN